MAAGARVGVAVAAPLDDPMETFLRDIRKFAEAANAFEHVQNSDPMITIAAPLSELRRLRAVYKAVVRKR